MPQIIEQITISTKNTIQEMSEEYDNMKLNLHEVIDKLKQERETNNKKDFQIQERKNIDFRVIMEAMNDTKNKVEKIIENPDIRMRKILETLEMLCSKLESKVNTMMEQRSFDAIQEQILQVRKLIM